MAKATAEKNTAKTASNDTATLSTSYNEIPYSSYPFAQTAPELLQGIGRLFGLNAPSPSKARILEIGSAAGNNIISMAARYPASTCVGIDYAVKQIEAGQKLVKEMGLTNVVLKHLSVMDIDKSFGEFDYIITHGVMSWVPTEVQEKILEVCSTNLSPDGIAYVSYNTLPGWNSVRSVRELMLYHSSMYNTAPEKAQAARQILKFIGDSARSNNNLQLAQVIERENEILNNQPDSYLLHEHLEENNHQFYFHEFMAMAAKKNLQYLGETSLEKMFSGNFSPEIAEVLATSTDIVRTEQYMDYINDRRFRCTLLCHKDRILNRTLNSTDLLDGYVYNRFAFPENFKDINIAKPETQKFNAASGMVLTTDDQVAVSILKALFDHQAEPIHVKKLVKNATESLKKIKHPLATRPEAEIQDAVCQIIMRYIFIAGVYFYTEPQPYTSDVSAKPTVSKLALFQATMQPWISSQRQEHIGITPFDNKLIAMLDGTRDVAMLIKEMLPFFASKELVMNEHNAPIDDLEIVESRLPEFITSAFQRYAALAMLVK